MPESKKTGYCETLGCVCADILMLTSRIEILEGALHKFPCSCSFGETPEGDVDINKIYKCQRCAILVSVGLSKRKP